MPAEHLLEKAKKLFVPFFEKMDPCVIDQLVERIKDTNGLLFFSGVGKSGLVAQKVAVTLTSTGTRALYLSPTDSLHGDMGLVGKGDHVFLFSKSGESDELLSMIPYLRNRGALTTAIVCEPKSRLAKACQERIVLPVEEELCPFNLAPTISTSAQLLFGDLFAMALVEAKQFTADHFALNHPGGKLGRRATMKVKDLMVKGEELPLAEGRDKLIDSLVELSNKRAGCLLIHDGKNHLLGIFTDGDLRRALQNKGASILELPLSELMTRDPKAIESETLLVEALKVMESDQKHPIMVLPVISTERQIEGLIKLHDIIQAGV